MHLRVVTVRRDGKIRRYAQLVQSYRRPDGMPAQKVLAGLGELPETTLANLKIALKASRQGRTLVLPEIDPQALGPMTVRANLRYLDLAVASHVWRGEKLADLLAEVLPQGGEAVPHADVIGALVLQRCVAPRSKRFAQEWLPTTALPELLGLDPARFTNSRIHRSLDALDSANAALQNRLPRVCQAVDPVPLSALFLDVTDVYFVGRGPALAEYGRTKEGFSYKRRVGVVLLCDQGGRPLRWEVVSASRTDSDIMGKMVDQLASLDWIKDSPVVCDRAMGNGSSLARWHARGLRFLTAVPINEIESTIERMPCTTMAQIKTKCTIEARESDLAQLAQSAQNHGFTRIDDITYVMDLGVGPRLRSLPPIDLSDDAPDLEQDDIDDPCDPDSALDQVATESTTNPSAPQSLSGAAGVLLQIRAWQTQLDAGVVRSPSALARKLGMSAARLSQMRSLRKLSPKVQEALLGGLGPNLSEFDIRSIRNLDAETQWERFLQLQARAGSRSSRARVVKDVASTLAELGAKDIESALAVLGAEVAGTNADDRKNGPLLRRVVYFNPQMCLDMRLRAAQHRQEIDTFISALNARLRAPRSRLAPEAILRRVRHALSRRNLWGAHDVAVTRATAEEPWQVTCTLIRSEWHKRRQYDGFVLLVGHHELPQTGAELVRLYRAKDAVEKDFQTIKGVVKLRPIFHHTDPKVRAHVTLCMLALLLSRSVEHRLQGTSVRSATACWEALRTCHLNLLDPHPVLGPVYTVTRPNDEQRMLLRHLKLEELTDDVIVAQQISPR